jgi:hypothetical protein
MSDPGDRSRTDLPGRDGPPVDIEHPDIELPDISLLGAPFARIDDSVPLLLLPVRVETRYHLGTAPPQLLVRIYPDPFHIRQPLAPPTAEESELASTFWRTWYSDRADRRNGWSALVARTGRRRAGQLAQMTAPVHTPGGGLELPDLGLPRGPWLPGSTQVGPALLPRQWVVSGYDGQGDLMFQVGSGPIRRDLRTMPRPDAATSSVSDTGLEVDDELAWMVDYEGALAEGMAVTVDLAGSARAAADGVPLLVVTGVDAELDRNEATQELSRLLETHRATTGLAFVPQGTATNNTETTAAGWAPGEDLEPVEADGEPSDQDNAAVLSQALGLGDPASWRSLHGGTDRETAWSQAMRVVGFEGVIGTFARQLLEVGYTVGVDPVHIDQLRQWFIDHVTGGASVPTLRIGRQPYGILPVQASTAQPDLGTVEGNLQHVVDLLRADWDAALLNVPRLDHGATDSSLDAPVESVIAMILASQPHPARLLMRRLQDFESLSNLEKLFTPQDAYDLALAGLDSSTNPHLEFPYTLVAALYQVLSFGFAMDTVERQLAVWRQVEQDLPGWFETHGSPLDPEAEGFVAAVISLLEAYQTRQYPLTDLDIDFQGALGQENTKIVSSVFSPTTTEWGDAGLVEAANPPPGHTARDYLADLARTFEERHDDSASSGLDPAFHERQPLLYQFLVSTLDLIPDDIRVEDRVPPALEVLQELDAGTLEWLFRETLGLGSHRLDAWHTSLATARLAELRSSQPRGLQIGAYGVLTDLVPRSVQTPSQGFVHAPSVGQAATAAVLRAGWLAHGDANPESAFAIDLSSRRVRDAGWLLDGVRGGQPLGDLLGYRFERTLHDRGADHFIHPTRQAVLEANGRADEPPDQPVDGLELIELVDAGSIDLEPEADEALLQVRAAFDAVNDLALAEGVHQLASGNFGRAAAMLDAIATGESRPPQPEVVETHRTATSVEHRVLVLLPTSPSLPADGWSSGTRGRLAPALEHYVASLLPRADQVGFAIGGSPATLADLDLAALDAISLVDDDPHQASAPIATLVACADHLPEGELDAGAGGGAPVTLTEFATLAIEIRRLIDGARVADARDLRAGGWDDDGGIDERPLRTAAATEIEAFLGDVEALRAATAAAAVDDQVPLVARFARRGIAVAGAAPAGPSTGERLLALAEARVARIEALGRYPVVGAEVASAIRGRPGTQHGRIPVPGDGPIDGPTDLPLPQVEPLPLEVVEQRLAATLSHRLPLLGSFRFVPSEEADDVVTLVSPDSDGLDDEIDDWLDVAGRVRPSLGRLTQARLLSELLAPDAGLRHTAAQHPNTPGDRWAATHAPGSPGGRLSAVLVHGPDGVPPPGSEVAGLVVDRWVEQIPSNEAVTGLAFHYDAPSNQAPQACLLAVPPRGETWTLPLVLTTIRETVDWVRRRAVAPEDLRGGGRSIPSIYRPGAFQFWPEEETV